MGSTYGRGRVHSDVACTRVRAYLRVRYDSVAYFLIIIQFSGVVAFTLEI